MAILTLLTIPTLLTMALLPYSLEQVDEQLMRFGEDHAELRAEVRE